MPQTSKQRTFEENDRDQGKQFARRRHLLRLPPSTGLIDEPPSVPMQTEKLRS
jgi:hypothetical protein